MDKEDIINYVIETPGNSNPAVLGSMLDSYSGGDSSGGGGGGVLNVNITTTDWAHGTADKTFEEITAAINTGYVINAKIVGENYIIPLRVGEANSSTIVLNSLAFLVSDNLLETYDVNIRGGNFIDISYYSYTLTPAT